MAFHLRLHFLLRVLVQHLNGIFFRFLSPTIGIEIVQPIVRIRSLSFHSISPFIFSLCSIQVGENSLHRRRSRLSRLVSLARCSRVNKLWSHLSSYPELWRRLCQQKKWAFSSVILDQEQIASHTDADGRAEVKQREGIFRRHFFSSFCVFSGKRFLSNDFVWDRAGWAADAKWKRITATPKVRPARSFDSFSSTFVSLRRLLCPIR